MPLEEAVALWVRSHYYMLRPWMHPRRDKDPAFSHVPVTEDLVLAEDTLLRAFLGTKLFEDHELDIHAAIKAEAAVWHDDLVSVGKAKPKASEKRKPRTISVEPTKKHSVRRSRNLFDRS